MARLQGCIGDVIVLTVDNAFTLSRSGLRFDSDEREYGRSTGRGAGGKASRSGDAGAEAVGFNAQGLLAAGTPIEVIPEQMALFNCDLLIISHRHLSSLGRWLNASVTRGLLDEIGQPVLVIPR